MMKNILNLWEEWKRIAYKISNFQAKIILTLFYFLIITPFSIGVKLLSDPLSIKSKRRHSNWMNKDTFPNIEGLKRQF